MREDEIKAALEQWLEGAITFEEFMRYALSKATEQELDSIIPIAT